MKAAITAFLIAQIAVPFRLPIPGLFPVQPIKPQEYFNKNWLLRTEIIRDRWVFISALEAGTRICEPCTNRDVEVRTYLEVCEPDINKSKYNKFLDRSLGDVAQDLFDNELMNKDNLLTQLWKEMNTRYFYKYPSPNGSVVMIKPYSASTAKTLAVRSLPDFSGKKYSEIKKILENAEFILKDGTPGYILWEHGKDKSLIWIERNNGRLQKIGLPQGRKKKPAVKFCVNKNRYIISPDHANEFIKMDEE
jgi:hypothetical protein